MMILPIAQLGQPVLRRTAEPVRLEHLPTDEFQGFVDDMVATLDHAGGVGLAAPQVFDGRRLFLAAVLPPSEGSDHPQVEVFVNPKLVEVGGETIPGWEGCLSFLELSVLVPRHERVVVDYLDRFGGPRRIELTGFPARVVQHENDHLDGILTIDRAASTRDIVKSSELRAHLGTADSDEEE